MISKERIINIIFDTIDEINLQLPREQHLKKNISTDLLKKLDSMGVVNLIVLIEQKVEDEFDVTLSISDNDIIFQKDSPLKSVETLIDFVHSILS